ncbi:hypothetical protein [Gordonia soli]|uniref:Uncharacterized protein n=1 Tax=Gordonia soli NBRC 108243 TaxID=1223545 RepID=M0QQ43_9ACTN|nr:hypothetical protein [Gordonia soli]GAC70509.1 hypothetical protein GS4_35_00850 [Gordonia soli NBRC 108243]
MIDGPEPVVYHLATHSLLLALPAVVPAFLLVGIIMVIVVRDRRLGDDDDDLTNDDEPSDPPAGDGTGSVAPEPTENTTGDEADDPDHGAR